MIREHVTADDVVCAVAWAGPVMPGLKPLLGDDVDRYQDEASRQSRVRRGRGPLTVALGDLVVQSTGHARAFAERAYLRRLAPDGFNLDADGSLAATPSGEALPGFVDPRPDGDEVGEPLPGDVDWGRPFFPDRTVFTAIEGQDTPRGPGPYVAY